MTHTQDQTGNLANNMSSAIFKCPSCEKETKVSESCEGVCISCNKEGVWVDPAGGVHYGDDNDPASMYE